MTRRVLSALILAATAVAGARAQTPINALSLTQLQARADTVETWSRQGPGAPIRGSYYERIVSGSRDLGWILELRWYDTTRAWFSTQRTETRPGGLVTRVDRVRGLLDSASLLVTGDRAAGWVVPRGQQPTLVEGTPTSDFANPDVAVLAIAAARPVPGTVFLVPHNRLFSATPVATAVDTLRVLGVARLRYNGREVDCQTISGTQGRVYWVERATGRMLARRATTGPVTFWHVVAGVTPPEF